MSVPSEGISDDGGELAQETTTQSRIHTMKKASVGKVMALMALSFFTAANASNPNVGLPVDRVDLIEINHFYDAQGRPVFDQIIFYDWSREDKRYQIRDWRLLKNPNQIPLQRTKDGQYVAIWMDFKSRDVIRTTESKLIRETWTQHDPELVERNFLLEAKRKKLKEPPAHLHIPPVVLSQPLPAPEDDG